MTDFVIAIRIFIVIGITYLSIVATLVLVRMRRLNGTLANHNEALHTHSKRLAAMLALMASPDPPVPSKLASLSSRPLKVANVIAMVAREAADELTDE